MSTPGTITHRTPVTGVNNPAYQVSKNAWNEPLVVASAAPDGAVLVKDATQSDGWGAVPVLTPAQVDLSGVVPITRTINGQPLSTNIVIGTDLTGGVPFQRTVNGHELSADVVVTKADIGLGNVENVAVSTLGLAVQADVVAALATKAPLTAGAVAVVDGGTGRVSQSLAAAATLSLGVVEGFLFLASSAHAHAVAVVGGSAGHVAILLDASGAYGAIQGIAGLINVYWTGSEYRVENQTAGALVVTVSRIGA